MAILQYLAIQDTYIDSAFPDTGFGTSVDLFGESNRASLIKFANIPDLSEYVINSIKLKVYAGSFGTTTPTININSIESSFNEFQTNYNNSPSFNFINGFSVSLPSGGSAEIDITDIYSEIINLNLFGLALTGSFVISSIYGVNGAAELLINVDDLPPTPPTILSPLTGQIVDKDETLTISWDVLNQDEFEAGTSTNGTTYATVTGTTSKTYEYPASTFAVGSLYVRVRTKYDGTWTDYSEVQLITVAEKPPAPSSITSGTITTALPLITWTATNLATFALNIYDSLGALIETGVGSTNSYQTLVPLSDLETYTIKITYTDTNGLTSPEGQSTVTTAFITPTKPTFVLVDNGYYITGTIDNIDATAIYNDIYKLVDGVWIRVKKELGLDSVFYDFNLKSGVEYQYKVRAFSAGLGYVESDVEIITISFLDVYLTTINQGLQLKWNPVVTKSTLVDRKLMKFAGREQRVAEYGDGTNIDFSVLSFRIKTKAELDTLESMIKERGTILYRDMRGTLVNLSIAGLSANYDTIGYIVTFNGANEILVSEVV